MQVLITRNVNTAFLEAVRHLNASGVLRDSRNGPVIVYPCPFTTVYKKPKERVLFHPIRDANPFFHLMEAMWMLAGREDVEFVAQFSSNMRNYSDDGKVLNAAYGYRWRHYFSTDQLPYIINALIKDPHDRRQVLTMWSVEDLTVGNKKKDIPCNTQAYFQIGEDGDLDMMVCNRSNDAIWGTYGANAVHFSFLQEYLADMIGTGVGVYWQTSFNTHFYPDKHLGMVKTVASIDDDWNYYQDMKMKTVKLVTDRSTWLRDLRMLLSQGPHLKMSDPFLAHVVAPVWLAWLEYKKDNIPVALEHLGFCYADDWRIACEAWLRRRMK